MAPDTQPASAPFSADWRHQKWERLRYKFDKIVDSGPGVLIGLLALVSLALVLITALLLWLLHIQNTNDSPKDVSLPELVWRSLMHAMDPGNVASDRDWKFRLVMLGITVAGLLLVGGLISILNSALEGELNQLRRGRSRVVEEGHVLILGWSPSIFTVIAELKKFHQQPPKSLTIVILAAKDKVEMDEAIRARISLPAKVEWRKNHTDACHKERQARRTTARMRGEIEYGRWLKQQWRAHRSDLRRTRIICRTGSPMDLHDLEIVRPHEAASILVLSPRQGAASDAHVIKTVLALITCHSPGPTRPHQRMVAEIKHEKNLRAAALIKKPTEEKPVMFVSSDNTIARITVQTSRQPGMSVIYTELLDYDGNEIYCHPVEHFPALENATYGQTLQMFRNSALIGVRWSQERLENEKANSVRDAEAERRLSQTARGEERRRAIDSRVQLNPPPETPLKAGDEIIVVAEDETLPCCAEFDKNQIENEAIHQGESKPRGKEDTLILGWNSRGGDILRELNSYVAPGSEARVVCLAREAKGVIDNMKAEDKCHQEVEYKEADPCDGEVLRELDVARFSHVIVLADDEANTTPEAADASTMITLLHLRDIKGDSGQFSIVSEMFNDRNRELAEIARADDFIVSDKLISSLMAQISQEPQLNEVFAKLLDKGNAEIHLYPVSDYLKPEFLDSGQGVNFYTIAQAALQRNQSAIGYRQMADKANKKKKYGVKLNPDKAEAVRFEPGDFIIVVGLEPTGCQSTGWKSGDC